MIEGANVWRREQEGKPLTWPHKPLFPKNSLVDYPANKLEFHLPSSWMTCLSTLEGESYVWYLKGYCEKGQTFIGIKIFQSLVEKVNI